MHTGKLIFSQVMEYLPIHTFHQCVSRYQGDHYTKRFRCYDQYLIMSFAQFTHRESLRDIEACILARQSKLYHMGIRSLKWLALRYLESSQKPAPVFHKVP